MKNKYEICGDIVKIYLSGGSGEHIALIDIEDLPLVINYPNTWIATKFSKSKFIYVVGHVNKSGRKTNVLLHRWLLDAQEGVVVDHINHNTLDNRRSNLRLVTIAENQQNRVGAQSNSSSGIRGVSWCNKRQKWCAELMVGKMRMRDAFNTKEEASRYIEEMRAKYMPYSKEASIPDRDFTFDEQERKRAKKLTMYRHNTSGVKGVSWSNYTKKWKAVFDINKKTIFVGWFKDLETAKNAVLKKKKEMGVI